MSSCCSLSEISEGGSERSVGDRTIGSPQQQDPSDVPLDPSLCRHFALRGTCRFQNGCYYSHILPDDCADWNEACQRIPCPHYIKGMCRYRNMCRLAHVSVSEKNPLLQFKKPSESLDVDPEDLDCKQPAASSNAPSGSSIDYTGSSASASSSFEEWICGICLEPLGQTRNNRGEIKHNRKKFGLLSSCDHIFCIQCLRTWRYQQKKETLNERDDPRADDAAGSDRVRACPACRQPSDFIVPSDRFCVGEEKEQVVASYQARLSCTPCRRFNGKLGSCPFGSDCFYAHWDCHTGEDMKEQDKSKQQLWHERAVKQRVQAERRRVQRRRLMFPGLSNGDMQQVMESVLYLTSLEALLDSSRTSNGEGGSGDADVGEEIDAGLITDRLMYVDDNGNARIERAGRTVTQRQIEAILERLYSMHATDPYS